MKNRSVRSCFRVLAAVGVSLVFPSLFAETVTVGNVSDLVSALNRLNPDKSKSHTIVVEPGRYDVSGAAVTCEDVTASAHLALHSLTLRGATSDPRDVVIYGDRSNRILACADGTVRNLTISNGYLSATASAKNGAGVFGKVVSSMTVLSNVVVTCCETVDGTGGGCATVGEIRDCQFIGNAAKYGGGIGNVYAGTYANPRVGMFSGLLKGNTVTMSGGGSYNSMLSGVRIEGNSAVKYGGGVFDNDTNGKSVSGCTVISNSAGSAGGGIYLTGTGCVSNTLVACNNALYSGGGIYSANGNLVRACVISNNVCDGTYSSDLGCGGGGGVCRVRLEGCLVIGNCVTNSVVTDTTRSSNGGGIYRCDFVTNCTIVGNSAVNNGGGAYNSKLIGCIVSNNLSHCYGGGVNGCAVTGSRIVHNLSENTKGVTKVAGGGGAYGSFVTNSLVAGNAALPTSGRVAEACGGAGQDTVFSGCVVRDNYAAVGAAMQGGNAYDSTFSNNASKNGNYIFRQTKVFENCDICGGLIDSAAVLSNCRVHDFRTACYATIAPGANVVTSGVFAATSSSQTLFGIVADKTYALSATNTLVYGNQVDLLFWATTGNTLRLVNCTVVSNRADKTCTGVGMVDSGAAEMLNTMFVDNRTKNGSAARDYYPESKGNTNVVARNCIFGVGEKYALPRVMENCAMDKVVRFLPAADDGYPFQPKRQKCVTGAGLVEDWMATANDVRGEGFPRLRDGLVDIGCYQNWLPLPGMMMLLR